MRKKICLFFVPILSMMLLAACGSGNRDSGAPYHSKTADTADTNYGRGPLSDTTDDVYLAKAEEAGMYAAGSAGADTAAEVPVLEASAPQVGANGLTSRKLIRNANMNVETEEFDVLMATVEERVRNLGGYIENYSTSKNSMYYGGNENRYASLTARIPADHYDRFVSEISRVSNVLNRNESVQDVTLQYVDLESHKKTLRTEQERLLVLLEKAENIEDIIKVESRLSEVRYQIESMESQLRTYDNLVDYSTIYLNVSEVKQLTPVQEQTAWEKISVGFVRNWKTLGIGFKNLIIWLIVTIPYLLVMAVITVTVLLIVRRVLRKNEASKHKNDNT